MRSVIDLFVSRVLARTSSCRFFSAWWSRVAKKSGPKSLCDRFKEMSYSDRTVRSTLSRLKVSGWLQVILFYAMFSI